MSIDCDANKTRHYVEESCMAVKEESEDKEDLDADLVTEWDFQQNQHNSSAGLHPSVDFCGM
jgi:hypothetical protein